MAKNNKKKRYNKTLAEICSGTIWRKPVKDFSEVEGMQS